jgi:hypothetical protein
MTELQAAYEMERHIVSLIRVTHDTNEPDYAGRLIITAEPGNLILSPYTTINAKEPKEKAIERVVRAEKMNFSALRDSIHTLLLSDPKRLLIDMCLKIQDEELGTKYHIESLASPWD